MNLLNKYFNNKNNWLATLFFFPLIYLLGWILISLLATTIPFLEANKSLYGTLITFCLFILSLPYWIKFRWKKSIHTVIGEFRINNNLLRRIFYEFIKSLTIILIIVICLISGGFSALNIKLNTFVFLNSLFLAIFVGIAEELVFRVWLFEELNLKFNTKVSSIFQAILFAIAHLKIGFTWVSNIQIFLGLFLFGIYLDGWRYKRNPSVILAICFHGFIVGIWFLVDNSFLILQNDVPNIIFGPGVGNSINPIGGLFGIMFLGILNFCNSKFILLNFFNKKNYSIKKAK